jgi:hypothetical protein
LFPHAVVPDDPDFARAGREVGGDFFVDLGAGIRRR